MKNNKSLGQHWLKNREVLNQIADLAVTRGIETCLEIGPGLGTLTSSLLKRFEQIIAIEFDPRLAANLPKSFPGKNLVVENADFLQYQLPDHANYVVAGNIPYYITSPIIKKLLETPVKPAKIVLLIQKEVAERLAAEPGDHSSLSIFAQNLAEVELGPLVPAVEFTPPPKVDSQVIVLTPRSEPVISDSAMKLARRGFASPRKKLATNLADAKHSREDWRKILEQEGINPDARAQDLELIDWETLAHF